MILFSYFRSSASYRVRIALNLKNIDFEYRPIHLVKDGGEQNQLDYLKLNPMAQVPTLQHEEVSLTQSMAILQYLDQLHPVPRLFPEDAVKNAKTIEIAEIINTGIQPVQNLSVMNYVDEKHDIGKDGKFAWAHHWIDRGFKALESVLEKTASEYSLGDSITAADLFLVPQAYNARRFKVDMSLYPTIARVDANCLRLEAFQKAAPEVQPDAT